jgi:hypothetical protein
MDRSSRFGGSIGKTSPCSGGRGARLHGQRPSARIATKRAVCISTTRSQCTARSSSDAMRASMPSSSAIPAVGAAAHPERCCHDLARTATSLAGAAEVRVAAWADSSTAARRWRLRRPGIADGRVACCAVLVRSALAHACRGLDRSRIIAARGVIADAGRGDAFRTAIAARCADAARSAAPQGVSRRPARTSGTAVTRRKHRIDAAMGGRYRIVPGVLRRRPGRTTVTPNERHTTDDDRPCGEQASGRHRWSVARSC